MSNLPRRKFVVASAVLLTWVAAMAATRSLAANWMTSGIEGNLERRVGRSVTLAEARVYPEWSLSPLPFVSVGSITCVAGGCAFGQWVVAVDLPGLVRNAWFFG